MLTPSGLASITDILSAFLRPGDHLLMTDSCYGPTRRFCCNTLAPRGIDTTFYDPLAGAGIARSLRENTRLVFMASPGSATFRKPARSNPGRGGAQTAAAIRQSAATGRHRRYSAALARQSPGAYPSDCGPAAAGMEEVAVQLRDVAEFGLACIGLFRRGEQLGAEQAAAAQGILTRAKEINQELVVAAAYPVGRLLELCR